ncbi:MAG: hypothetical protein QXV17_08890 [Candidatus Micrarchaeaceae archaeon]
MSENDIPELLFKKVRDNQESINKISATIRSKHNPLGVQLRSQYYRDKQEFQDTVMSIIKNALDDIFQRDNEIIKRSQEILTSLKKQKQQQTK